MTAVCCHDGEIFFGMETGLGIPDAATETVTEVHGDATTGMRVNPVASIAVQGERVWIGGNDSGAAVLDRTTGEWTHFAYDWDKIGKGGPAPRSTYLPCIFTRENSVFFPMNGIPECNVITREWNHYMRGPFCNYAVRDGDILWYCAEQDGIFSFDMDTKVLRRHFVRTPSWLAGAPGRTTPSAWPCRRPGPDRRLGPNELLDSEERTRGELLCPQPVRLLSHELRPGRGAAWWHEVSGWAIT